MTNAAKVMWALLFGAGYLFLTSVLGGFFFWVGFNLGVAEFISDVGGSVANVDFATSVWLIFIVQLLRNLVKG